MSRPSQRQQFILESCLTQKSRCLQGVEPQLKVPIRRMSFFKNVILTANNRQATNSSGEKGLSSVQACQYVNSVLLCVSSLEDG